MKRGCYEKGTPIRIPKPPGQDHQLTIDIENASLMLFFDTPLLEIRSNKGQKGFITHKVGPYYYTWS